MEFRIMYIGLPPSIETREIWPGDQTRNMLYQMWFNRGNQERIRTKKRGRVCCVTSQNLNWAEFLKIEHPVKNKLKIHKSQHKICLWHAQNSLFDAWTFNVYVINTLWFCT